MLDKGIVGKSLTPGMRSLTWFLIVSVVIFWVGMSSARKNGSLMKANHDKARYYLLEGMNKMSVDSFTIAHEYLRKAFKTDSTFPEAAYMYGLSSMVNDVRAQNSDSIRCRYELLMRRYVDSHPEDFSSSDTYMSLFRNPAEMLRVSKRLLQIYPQRTALWRMMAMAHMMRHETDSALRCLEEYERVEGRTLSTAMERANIYYSVKGDTTAAMQVVDKGIAADPGNSLYYIAKSTLFEAMMKPDSAKLWAERALEIDNTDGAVYYQLANIALQTGDTTTYVTRLGEALLADNADPDEKGEWMAEYLQSVVKNKSATDAADKLLRRLLDDYPFEPGIRALSARYHAARNQLPKALEEINYALDMSPDNAQYLESKMQYLMSLNRFEEAKKLYDHCRNEEIGGLTMMMLGLSANTRTGDYIATDTMTTNIIDTYIGLADKYGVDSISRASWIKTNIGEDTGKILAQVYTLRGDNNYEWGRKKEAVRDYEAAMIYAPEEMYAYNNVAYYITEDGGDFEYAERLSRTAIENEPDNPTYLDTYAWVLYKLERYDEALEWIKRAISIAESEKDESAEYYLHLGDIYKALNNQREAKEAWLKAQKLDPDNKDVKERLMRKGSGGAKKGKVGRKKRK